MPGYDLLPASAALRQRLPCRPIWMRWTSHHWSCRAARAVKCVQHPSNDCSILGTYTSSPVRMTTSNVPWGNASKGPCRAWFVATWQPTGRSVLWTSCWPCCAPTTPHITAPLTWHLVRWTGPMQSARECLYSPPPWQHLRWVVGLGYPCLSPGDWVRMSKTHCQFTKGYQGHCSKESFTWRSCETPALWPMVADAASEPIKGNSYATGLLWHGSHPGTRCCGNTTQ